MTPLRTWVRTAAPGLGLLGETLDTAERLPSGMAGGPAWFIAVDGPGAVTFDLQAALAAATPGQYPSVRDLLGDWPIARGPVSYAEGVGFVVTPGTPRELPRPRSVWPTGPQWYGFDKDPCVLLAVLQANPSAPAGEYRFHLIRGQSPASV